MADDPNPDFIRLLEVGSRTFRGHCRHPPERLLGESGIPEKWTTRVKKGEMSKEPADRIVQGVGNAGHLEKRNGWVC